MYSKWMLEDAEGATLRPLSDGVQCCGLYAVKMVKISSEKAHQSKVSVGKMYVGP
jgi:hypothetical protein